MGHVVDFPHFAATVNSPTDLQVDGEARVIQLVAIHCLKRH